MICIRIQGATRQLGPPSSLEGVPISGLAIRDGEHLGLPIMESAWELLPVELERLARGAKVYLCVAGAEHPPVALYVGEIPE